MNPQSQSATSRVNSSIGATLKMLGSSGRLDWAGRRRAVGFGAGAGEGAEAGPGGGGGGACRDEGREEEEEDEAVAG